MFWRRFTTPMKRIVRNYATDADGNPKINQYYSANMFRDTPGAQSAFWLFIAATLGYMFYRSRERSTYKAEEEKKVNHYTSGEKPRIVKEGKI